MRLSGTYEVESHDNSRRFIRISSKCLSGEGASLPLSQGRGLKGLYTHEEVFSDIGSRLTLKEAAEYLDVAR